MVSHNKKNRFNLHKYDVHKTISFIILNSFQMLINIMYLFYIARELWSVLSPIKKLFI